MRLYSITLLIHMMRSYEIITNQREEFLYTHLLETPDFRTSIENFFKEKGIPILISIEEFDQLED